MLFFRNSTRMSKIIEDIRQELKKNADEKTRIQGERFFKENVKLYGIKSAVVTRIGKDFYKKISGKNKSRIFILCEELWRSGYLEESGIACNWSYYVHKEYESDDFKIFERWVNDYVISKKATMPRTALRYAIEKMPKELKALAMAK